MVERSQTLLLLTIRKAARGGTNCVFRTVVISSARAMESAGRPVSPASRSKCVGLPAWWTLVDSGITRTVSAESRMFRASLDTTITGRRPFSGGSVGNCRNQISPRFTRKGILFSRPIQFDCQEFSGREVAPFDFFLTLLFRAFVVVFSDLLFRFPPRFIFANCEQKIIQYGGHGFPPAGIAAVCGKPFEESDGFRRQRKGFALLDTVQARSRRRPLEAHTFCHTYTHTIFDKARAMGRQLIIG